MILDRDNERSSVNLVANSSDPSIRWSCVIYNVRVLLAYVGSIFGLTIFCTWEEAIDDLIVIRYLYLTFAILGLLIYHIGGCVLSVQVFAKIQDEDETRYFCFCLPWPLSKFLIPIQIDTGEDYGHGQADPKIWHHHPVLTISLLTCISDLSSHIPFLILNFYMIVKEDLTVRMENVIYTFLICNFLAILYHTIFLIQYLSCKITATATNGEIIQLQGLYRRRAQSLSSSQHPNKLADHTSGDSSPLHNQINFNYSDIPDLVSSSSITSKKFVQENNETDLLISHHPPT